MKKDILVSVVVPVYNHEAYIEQCINGILKQKTDFNYEVLIGEDCSSDSSCDVLKRMAKNFPSHFKVFYRENNMGMGKTGNAADLYKKAIGKYFICCEGDDFWIDENKLQNQVDFLEKYPEYIAVAHSCIVVDKNAKILDEVYPSCTDDEYSFERFMTGCLPGQTATILCKREYFEVNDNFNANFQKYQKFPGDRKNAFLMLCMGKVKCLQSYWSAYRHVSTEGSSFSATMKNWDEYYYEQFLFYESIYDYAKENGNCEAIYTTSKLYYYALLKYCIGRHKRYSFNIFIKKLSIERDKIQILNYIFRRSFVTVVYFKFNLPIQHNKYFV